MSRRRAPWSGINPPRAERFSEPSRAILPDRARARIGTLRHGSCTRGVGSIFSRKPRCTCRRRTCATPTGQTRPTWGGSGVRIWIAPDRSSSRSFVLTGDAVHHRSSMNAGLPCPCDMDALTAIRSIQRIKQVSASHQADIWVMHDPADWEALGGKTGGYA